MIKFEKVSRFADTELNLPTRKTSYSAGYDFEVAEDILIPSYFEMMERSRPIMKDLTLDLEHAKNSFKNFYDWAINNGYNKNLSIDRINNNSNYCPDNCRWTTAKEQANNRRSNHLITYKNRTQNILAWSKEKNVPYNTLLARINRYSWTIEKALETPVLES